jgi:hypothetical protein
MLQIMPKDHAGVNLFQKLINNVYLGWQANDPSAPFRWLPPGRLLAVLPGSASSFGGR